MKPLFLIILPLFLSQIYSCNKITNDELSRLYSDYYISGNNISLKKLTKSIRSNKKLDEIINISQQNGSYNPGSITLNDPKNNPFVVGYSTPKKNIPKKLYPLIIYLHGGTGTRRIDKGEKAWDMFSFLSDSIDIFLASPSANRDTRWWSSAGISRILMTKQFMTLNYPIDPDRIFLAGVSDGASACWTMANSIGDVFAGFFTISGLGEISELMGLPLYSSNLAKCNIYNINATNDRLYPIDRVNNFLQKLSNSGVTIKQKIYENREHGFDYKLSEKDTLISLITRWKRDHYLGFSQLINPNLPYQINNIIKVNLLKNNNSIPKLNGFYSKDTLNINSHGVESIDVIVPNNGKSSKIFIKQNKKLSSIKISKKISIEKKLLLNRYNNLDYNSKDIIHIQINN